MYISLMSLTVPESDEEWTPTDLRNPLSVVMSEWP